MPRIPSSLHALTVSNLVVKVKMTREPTAAGVLETVAVKVKKRRLIVRLVGNRIAFSPPLIISETEVAENEDWHFFLNQQLTASWYLAKAFVPAMKEAGWGRIIHVNGPDGYTGGFTRVPHSTAKGALRTLTKSLASGLDEFGITVNDVNPGFMDTVRDYETHPGMTPEFSARRAQERHPIKRQSRPDELAFAVAFLCSERSGAITGSAIHIDAGEKMFG